MNDYIIRATTEDNQIRAFFATTKQMVQEAREIHNTSPVATASLGRTITAGAMMGLMLKGNKDLITIQIKGDGPLKGIIVTSDNKANVKGYIYNPYVDIPLKSQGKLDVGSAIGNGSLSIIKDTGLKEPYIGQIDLVSGEIAEDLTYYFAQSEQTPTIVALGVLIDVDTSVKQAGGFIIQLMPNTSEEVISKLEDKIKTIKSVTQMLEENKKPEDMLNLILGDFGIKIMEKVPTQFFCNCSYERVEKALISIGIKDLEDILETDKKAKLNCHFCNKEYEFNKQQLKELVSNLKVNNS